MLFKVKASLACMRFCLKAQVLSAELDYLTILNSSVNIIWNKVCHSGKFSHTPDQVGIQNLPRFSFSYNRLGLPPMGCYMNGVPLCVWFLILKNVESIRTVFCLHCHILFFCVSTLFSRWTFNSFFICLVMMNKASMFSFIMVTNLCVELLSHE